MKAQRYSRIRCEEIKKIEQMLISGVTLKQLYDSCQTSYNMALAVTSVSIINGAYNNYFVDTSDLFNFLSTTEVKNLDARQLMVSHETNWARGFTRSGEEIGRVSYFCGAIHAPWSGRSILFLLAGPTDKPTLPGYIGSLFVSDGNRGQLFPIASLLQNNTNEDENRLREFISERNLILNLFLYMEAFPASIHEGCPAIALEPWEVKSKDRSFRISAHESLLDRSGPTPHFRRGHFRMLSSEHWTKKRGQVVFVRSTFVKGHAETVEDVGPSRVEMISK